MTSPKSAKLTEELAKDYADYVKVNLSAEMKNFHDIVENVTIRLEEFQSIVGMVETESTECMNKHIPKLRPMQKELNTLCRRIDALEHVLMAANVSLCALETAVDNAEADLGVGDRLFGILNPLSFFKKSQDHIVTSKLQPFESPPIYKTEDYFNAN